MYKFIIKQIDKFESKTYKDKVIYEYLYCLKCDNVNIVAFTELGDEHKQSRINETKKTYARQGINIEIIEVTYEEHINNND